jgi:hypothetical protein
MPAAASPVGVCHVGCNRRHARAFAIIEENSSMRTTRAYALAVAFGACAGLAPSAMGQGAAAPSGQAPVTHVQTVRELALVCDPSGTGVPRLEAIAYCQGFLTSFGQYHALLYPRNGPARPLFCVPAAGPTIAQSGIGFAATNRRWMGFCDGRKRCSHVRRVGRRPAPRATRAERQETIMRSMPLALLLLSSLGLSACGDLSPTEQRVATGALGGGAIGGIVGSFSGNAGLGVLLGAGVAAIATEAPTTDPHPFGAAG